MRNSLLGACALLDAGYFDIIEDHFANWSGLQILADLVIPAVLVCCWMVRDARSHGLPSRPFVAITVVAGSFGPLVYLVVCEITEMERRQLALTLDGSI